MTTYGKMFTAGTASLVTAVSLNQVFDSKWSGSFVILGVCLLIGALIAVMIEVD